MFPVCLEKKKRAHWVESCLCVFWFIVINYHTYEFLICFLTPSLSDLHALRPLTATTDLAISPHCSQVAVSDYVYIFMC